MKKLIIVLSLFYGITSCSEQEENQEPEKVGVMDKLDEYNKSMCDYNEDNDVSDSLVQMYDEILDKKGDYNQAKYDVNVDNWEGKSFYIENVVIENITVEDKENYLGNSISVDYGESFNYLFLPVSISIFVGVDTKEELSNYEIGEVVDLKGVISSGSSGDMGYYMHLYCGELIKLE